MTQRPVVRTAGHNDLAPLLSLAIETFRDTYAHHNTAADMDLYLREHFTAARLTEELQTPSSCFLLVHLGESLVGYAGLREQDPGIPTSVSPWWEIERFYVDKAWHGKGLAHPLMEACKAEALQRNYAGLWLGVWENNRRARRFYEKMGFRDEGKKDFVLGKDRQTDHILVFPL